VRNDKPVDVALTLLRTFSVVFPDNGFGVSKHVGNFRETGPAFKQSGRKGMALTMRVRALDSRFLEYGSQRPLRDPNYCPAGGDAVPEVVRAILGGVPRQRNEIKS